MENNRNRSTSITTKMFGKIKPIYVLNINIIYIFTYNISLSSIRPIAYLCLISNCIIIILTYRQ